MAKRATLLILLLMTAPAEAHGTWSNGEPVPAWVTRACCGPNDAHHLRPDQVHKVEDGYLVDGYPRKIYDVQTLPSEDGEFWAFYTEYTDADGAKAFSGVYCFFVPTFG